MEIKIFNVEHGFCASICDDNSIFTLIDCGHNSSTNFRPSNYLIRKNLRHLVISNFDEDHLSDFPNIFQYKKNTICTIFSNPSVTPKIIRKIKGNNHIGPGTNKLLRIMSNTTNRIYFPLSSEPIASFVNIILSPYLKYFWNNYPNFEDTNNLSLVTFLNYHDIHIIFPGDLEEEGWLYLLKDESFTNYLSKVNIFIASHHGREDGFCKKVFDYCNPKIIIISDESIKYNTQVVDYRSYSSGLAFIGIGNKYTLTTRNDGDIVIYQTPREPATIRFKDSSAMLSFAGLF